MAKRIKDMKKGNMYEWTYMGNQCVGHVTFTGPRVVRCHYAVGMWEDSDAIEDAEPDYLAIDINVADYDIDDIKDATIEQKERYTRVVKDYQDLIAQMNKEHKHVQKKSSWVTADDGFQKGVFTPGTPAGVVNDQQSTEGESEVYHPEMPNKIGLKVVGYIDINEKDGKVHPIKKSKEERKAEKKMMEAELRGEWTPKQAFQEIHSPSFYHYQDEEIISFSCNGRKGVAIGMVDDWNKQVGFYVAFNMFSENGITKWGDVVNGHEVNAWPEPVTVGKPDMAQKQIGEAFLMPMYRAEIDAYHAKVEAERTAWLEEQERLRKEDEERKAKEEEERKQREQDERNKSSFEPVFEEGDDEDAEVTKCIERMPYLPYFRNEKNLFDDREWPLWDDVPQDEVVTKLCGLHQLSQIVNTMQACKSNDKIGRTYILSSSYLDEMRRRKRDYLSEHDNFASLLGMDSTYRGTLIYRNADSMYTLMFRISIARNGREAVKFALFINNVLFLTDQEEMHGSMFRQPYQRRICYIHSLRDKLDSFCVGTMGLILTFIAMEKDAKRVIEKQTDGSSMATGVLMRSNSVNPDVDVRDATWYTSIFVNRTISVDSYKSHRWKGHGDEKTLEEVDVKAHTKGGFTMKAKVTK